MASDEEQLLQMGFSALRVKVALQKTKRAGLQPAMDYLFAHQDDPEPTEADLASEPAAEEEDSAANEEAAGSLQCDDCGRLFTTPALAEFHATKSGHQNFSESKQKIAALTEEEKKAKLAELKIKIAEKRALQAKQDLADQKANELIKRKSGSEARDAREQLQQQQILKDLAKKKKEKAEEAALRAEIKRQIEQDKKDRLMKKARSNSGDNLAHLAPVAAAPPPVVKAPVSGQSRLQFRIPNGAPIVHSFPSTETLQSCIDFLATKGVSSPTLQFTMMIPKRVIDGREEAHRSLADLGLTPSASLVVSL